MKPWWQRPSFLGSLLFCLMIGLGIRHTLQQGQTNQPSAKDIQDAQQSLPPSDVQSHLEPKPTGHSLPPNLIGAAGIIEPKEREIRLATQVPGIVATVLVQEGQVVTAQTPLIELHHASEQAVVRASQAEVLMSKAQLQRARSGARPEELAAAVADAQGWQARATNSRQSFERLDKLYQRKAVSEEEWSRAKLQAQADERSAEASTARAQLLQNGTRKEDILAAEAVLAQAEARLEQSQALLDRTILKAPQGGEILQILNKPGEYVNPASGAILIMGDTTVTRARLDVDERDVAHVALGQQGFVRADAYGEQSFPGKVVYIARRMGRKNIRTDEPQERMDTKILEVILELEGQPSLPQGLRVTGFFRPR